MQWVVPLVVLVAIGVASTVYLLKVRLPRDETAAGIAAFAAMSWREFIRLVLDALSRRGYTREFDREAPSGDDQYLLQRVGERSLLACKHGSSFVLGAPAVHDMANAMQLAGADSGLLLTQGHFADDARGAASRHNIELLDGAALWPELRPLMPDAEQSAIVAPVRARVQRHVAIAWGIALVAAALVFAAGLGRNDAATDPDDGTAAATAGPAARADGQPDAAEVPTDPAELERRRSDVAGSISTLPSVDRAVWSTQSTLTVHLVDTGTDAKAELCPLLERYPELRASRVQLQPPQGSTEPVRFLQCVTY